MDVVKKLILNEHYEFLISSFNRNSYNQDGRLVSSIYVALNRPSSQDIEQLRSLAAYNITDLSVLADEATVYQLQEIQGRINSIEESLSEDGTMRTTFTMGV